MLEGLRPWEPGQGPGPKPWEPGHECIKSHISPDRPRWLRQDQIGPIGTDERAAEAVVNIGTSKQGLRV